MGQKSNGHMTNETSLPEPKLTMHGLGDYMRVHGWTWRTTGGVVGLCGGIICPLVGSILTAIAWFTGPVWHGFSLRWDGTVLLFLTIPLLLFGGYCLDLADKQDREASRARLNK
jgi:hypothetical protein